MDAPAATAAPSAGCDSPKIGFQGPITGDGLHRQGAAGLRAVRDQEAAARSRSQQDTQLDPAQASTTGTKLHADASVLAVVGPAGSQEVLAVAPIYKKAQRLPFISGSATRTSLTNGSIPNFFRVVPNDSVQAPTTAKYIRQILKAKSVFIVDDQTAYSKPLANGVQANLRAGGVKVTRNSVNQKVTDFSSLVSKIGDDVDVVYLPWQIAANGQIFGQQMKEQGKSAIIFGSDGLDSGDFKIQGSYVSAFAPDIRGIKGNAAFIKGYGKKFVSNFGPPIRGQAAISAIQKACADGNATRRGAEAARATLPEDGARRQPAVHRQGRRQGREVLHLQARSRRQEDAGRLARRGICGSRSPSARRPRVRLRRPAI